MWVAFAVTFFQQKISEYIRILYTESAKTVNEMTLNELIKLTTLWTTGPWMLFTSIIYNLKNQLAFLVQRTHWRFYHTWMMVPVFSQTWKTLTQESATNHLVKTNNMVSENLFEWTSIKCYATVVYREWPIGRDFTTWISHLARFLSKVWITSVVLEKSFKRENKETYTPTMEAKWLLKIILSFLQVI